MLVRTIAATLFFATSAVAADSESDALAKATAGFYGVYMTLHPSDGIPDSKTRAKFAPFISPALDALFVDGEAAEDRYLKATKNQAPPLVEGDLFTPNFEGATAFRIGACASDPQGGHCAVTLTYDDHKNKPFSWIDTAFLVRTPAGWRVDDIAYGGTWDFGNKGRLTKTLKSAIAEGGEFSK
jgi:hypothetical protein